MKSQRALDSAKKLPAMKQEKTKKDKLFNDIVCFLERENWTWTCGGETHGKQFVTQLQECLWYIDGHHHTFSDRSHPIPSIFGAFSGYNTPELSKHRKRSHTNLSADTPQNFLNIGRGHIPIWVPIHWRNMKNFLLSPWMKKEKWATMKKATEELIESIEFYVFQLVEKNKAVKKNIQRSCQSKSQVKTQCPGAQNALGQGRLG